MMPKKRPHEPSSAPLAAVQKKKRRSPLPITPRMTDDELVALWLRGKSRNIIRPTARSLKSLLSFASKMGYLPFNVGAVIRGPELEQRLAERILSERQVFVLLEAVEDRPRGHALIRFLYNGGLRVSELSRSAGATSSRALRA